MSPLLTALSLILVASASAPVSVAVQRPEGFSLYTFAADIDVGGAEGVSVPSCDTVQVEVFDPASQRWAPGPGRACSDAEPAATMEPGLHRVKVVVPVERPTLARMLVVYGVGCQQNQPLELAGCRDLGAAVSSQVMVHPR